MLIKDLTRKRLMVKSCFMLAQYMVFSQVYNGRKNCEI